MFAAIYIADFFLQAALRLEPQLHSRPVALLDPAASQPVIFQLTDSARQAGITEGMTPTQALARCSQALIKARSRTQERSAAAALLDCALSFSPNVEATAEGIATLDLKGFPPMNYEELGQKIVSRMLLLNLAAQVGVAENPLLALQAARCARPVLLVENSKAFLAELPIESIEPSPQVLEILKKWGIETLGRFLALGKEALAVRLGPEAVELFERAAANDTRPLCVMHPAEIFEEEIEFDHEVETTQPLFFILKKFLEQISLRLQMVYLVAEEMTLRLTFADETAYEHVFKIPAPTRDIGPLFRMLQNHLETLQAEHPITALGLSAKPCRAASQQFDLFESALRDPNRFYETLARLAALVGADRGGAPVLEPTHRPDAFHLQAINPEGKAEVRGQRDQKSEVRSQRSEIGNHKSQIINHESELQGLCLRRFRPPLSMQLVRSGGTMVLNSSRSRERISKMSGPWPRSGDWWDNQRWCRVEWDVETEQGNLYRLFEQGGFWFLEGVYD